MEFACATSCCLETPYVVLHLRGRDKGHSAGNFDLYCTIDVLAVLSEYAVHLVVLSDDMTLYQRMLPHLPAKLPRTRHRGDELRDLAVLLQARGIVQHVEHGWSGTR